MRSLRAVSHGLFLVALTFLIVLLAASPALAQGQIDYDPSVGDMGQFTVDPVHRRAYVLLPTISSVSVIDIDAKAEIARVPIGPFDNLMYCAVNPDTQRVYITQQDNSAGDNVVVFDGVTRTVAAVITVSDLPGEVVVDRATKTAWVACYSGRLDVISGALNARVDSYVVDGGFRSIALDLGRGFAFLSHDGSTNDGQLSRLDVVTRDIQRLALPVRGGPMSVDPVTNRGIVGNAWYQSSATVFSLDPLVAVGTVDDGFLFQCRTHPGGARFITNDPQGNFLRYRSPAFGAPTPISSQSAQGYFDYDPADALIWFTAQFQSRVSWFSAMEGVLVDAPDLIEEDELQPISFTASASDVERPGAVYTFALENAPEGASIDASTGVFSWTPTEVQGPSESTFRVVATGDWTPSESNYKEVTIRVREANQAPTINDVPDQTVDEETLLDIQLTASDPDLPAQPLTFSLVAGPGIIDPPGVWRWTPTESQGPGTHEVTVRVTDPYGAPDETTFTVTVRDVRKVFRGRVDLQDFVGNPGTQSVLFEFYEGGSGTPIWVRYGVQLGSDGNFSFLGATNEIPFGTYRVACKGSHWLRRSVADVQIGPRGVEGLAFSLANGDCNGDNRVDIEDFLILAASYETTPPADFSADLNGDGTANLDDFLILAANYELDGD